MRTIFDRRPSPASRIGLAGAPAAMAQAAAADATSPGRQAGHALGRLRPPIGDLLANPGRQGRCWPRTCPTAARPMTASDQIKGDRRLRKRSSQVARQADLDATPSWRTIQATADGRCERPRASRGSSGLPIASHRPRACEGEAPPTTTVSGLARKSAAFSSAPASENSVPSSSGAADQLQAERQALGVEAGRAR